MNGRIAIISDTHIGVHGDSEKWHKIALDYATWLRGILYSHKIGTLWILGDVFDNRKSVGVETIQVARDFFTTITDDMNLNVKIIVGNHDSFFEDNSLTSSVSILDGWGNIEIVSGSPKEFTYGRRTILACPWGTDLNSYELGRIYDAVFGHFAISSFADVPGHLYTGGITPEDVTRLSPLVFSGHFHLRDDKEFSFGGKKKRIVIVGSPYQLNWADAGSSKGVYLYDTDSGDVDFIENTVSPKHVQISVGDDVSEKDVRNNIVRVMANSVEEAKKVQEYISGLKDYDAVDIGAKIVATDTSLPENFDVKIDGVFDQHQMLVDYINACDFGDKKEKVMEIMERIYKAAVSNRKESI